MRKLINIDELVYFEIFIYDLRLINMHLLPYKMTKTRHTYTYITIHIDYIAKRIEYKHNNIHTFTHTHMIHKH